MPNEDFEINTVDLGNTLRITHFKILPHKQGGGEGPVELRRIIQYAQRNDFQKIEARIGRTEPEFEWSDDPTVKFLEEAGFETNPDGDSVFGELKLD